MYMYKEDLTLNYLQWLICHKTKPNQTTKTDFKSDVSVEKKKQPTN